MLSSYRVLDLSDEKGVLCGKILGDLGADVIAIEPPEGNSARRIGPFYRGIAHPEKSLFWFAYALNKRGITLNLHKQEGRELFSKLVESADIVVESFPPGYMEDVGLGYSKLEEINPGIILTSITPYGPTGPYRDYKGSDLVLMSLGGLTYISGNPDRPPLRISYPQAYLHAGAYAAVGSMMALYHRGATGEGQHVDISIQECCEWASYHTPEWWDMMKVNLKRAGMWRVFGSVKVRTVYPCRDGFVTLWFLAGASASRGQYALVDWMDREGMCPDWLRGFDFEEWDIFNTTQELCDRLAEVITRFLLTKTKEELFEFARENELFLAPIGTSADVWENPQLRARHFWSELPHPELGSTITYPGPFIRSTEASPTIRRRAPLIGEHNAEIYLGELGLGNEQLAMLKGSGVI